jgi:MHS family shikimate/dehydroshikimate transporter-like MFS transporter
MATSPPARSHIRRVAVSSYLGTTIEYYDFLLYGTAAALVFNKVFFANLSPVLGTVVALATLAAGYVARLAGAILFGHFGDRIGRKAVMLTTMILMGVTSGLIGLLPTYGQVGELAPVLLVLLRLVQGIAVGGEYGGAVLMTAEHSSNKGRGLAGSAAAMGAPSGSVLATAAMALVTLLPEPALLSWGWRVPFLASFLLLAVGLYFRIRISESPVFLAQGAAPKNAGMPIARLLRNHPGTILKTIAFQVGPYCGQGVFGIFVISYAPSIGFARGAALNAILIGTILSVVVTPIYGALSDRVGRKPLVLFGSLFMAAIAYPGFLMVSSGSVVGLTAGVVLALVFGMTPVTAVAPVLLSELFPTDIRYTAVSTSYQLAQTLGSGFAPLIAASLLAGLGGVGWVAGFLIVVALLSALAIRLVPETRGQVLEQSDVVDGSVLNRAGEPA